MALTELIRAATRVAQTAVSDDAITAAVRALRLADEGELEQAIEALRYAQWMEA